MAKCGKLYWQRAEHKTGEEWKDRLARSGKIGGRGTVIVKKDLSRSVLKSLIVSQGEAVPGCEFSLGSDELYVRANA